MKLFHYIRNRDWTFSDLVFLLYNLIPLSGVLFFGWEAREVFVIYCLETIMVGIFTIFKLGITAFMVRDTQTKIDRANGNNLTGFFLIPFFIVHYGMFAAIQTAIFWSVGSIEEHYGVSGWDILFKFPSYLDASGKLMMLTLFMTYFMVFIKDYLASGYYKTAPLATLMFEPYKRIFIQQFTVIVGAMFLEFGANKLFMIIFILSKIFVEYGIDFSSVLQKVDAASKKS